MRAGRASGRRPADSSIPVPPDEFHAAVDELASKLAKAATFAIAMIKDAVHRGYDLPLDEAIEVEADNFARTALSTDAVANLICAQMLFLESEEPDKDIHLYINSPGGEITALFAIYDTLKFIKADVSTFCSGASSRGCTTTK